MTATVDVKIPKKLIPVFAGEADVRGAYGGRGSAKTRSFAIMTAVRAIVFASEGINGVILCGREYMNSLDESSMEEIKIAIRSEPWLAEHFDIGEKYIRTKCRTVHYVFSGLNRNIESLKSKARILICWVDEAEPVSDYAWSILIPTIREEGSELWITWNPERDGSATDTRFRKTDDPAFKVVEMNWRDNPKFSTKLNRERERDKANRPDSYGWIWEGEYRRVYEGAYYASNITAATEQGRIAKEGQTLTLPIDPFLTYRVFIDIGGTGAKADAFTMWIAQFVGQNINFLNYYETQGQPIQAHLAWLQENGYTQEKTQIWLPHDGATSDRVYDVSYQSAFMGARNEKGKGYTVTVIPNQGAGAAMQRIETARNQFHRMWFDSKCKAGLQAIAAYHEKRDEKRNIGLGPDHDWSSHGADSFGLAALCYHQPAPKNNSFQQSSFRGGSTWKTG